MNSQNKNMIMRLTCVLSSLLKQWKFIICIVVVCGMSFDVLSTITHKPEYYSTMQASLTSTTNSYSDLEGTMAYIKTLDYVFNGQSVLNYIKEKQKDEHLDMTCTIQSVDNSNVVNIRVASNSKRNAYHSLNHMIDWYKSNMTKYNFTYTLNVLENPVIHELPMNMNSHRSNFMKGAFVGGIIVVGLLAFIAYFRNTIKVSDDIEKNIECRLFARIPREIKPFHKKFWLKNKNAILISSLKTSFVYKEAIKKLRGRLEKSSHKHQYQAIMITGSLENEGKSSIAVNLALSLAQNQHKVLLIDGDLRKPSLHKILNVKPKETINDYLASKANYHSILNHLPKAKLDVIFAKADIENSEDLNNVDLWKALILKAKKDYDYIIVDSSPACFINDALVVNEVVDATLLVVKQHHATTLVINKTISRLVGVKNNLIGIIYNGSVIDWLKESKVHSYRYGYNHYNRKRGS